jgi:hypothetical protein
LDKNAFIDSNKVFNLDISNKDGPFFIDNNNFKTDKNETEILS